MTEIQRVKIAQTKALLDYVLRVEKELGEKAWRILSDQTLERRRGWSWSILLFLPTPAFAWVNLVILATFAVVWITFCLRR
jgi:hypothetical protein